MASIHQNIVDLLRTVATVVNSSGRFIYGRELHSSYDYANNTIASDINGKPLISLLPFVITKSTNEDLSFDSAEISMIFSRSADVQDSASKEEQILSEMSALCEVFISLLQDASKPVGHVISDVRMQAEYQMWMGTNSGFVTTFTLSMLQNCQLSSLEGLQFQLQSLLESYNYGN